MIKREARIISSTTLQTERGEIERLEVKGFLSSDKSGYRERKKLND